MAQERTVARPYAKAAFEFASEHKTLPEWTDMLAFAAAIASEPQMAALIKNPLFSRADLIQLFLSVGEKVFSAPMQNFIRVVGEEKRLPYLPAITDLYNELREKAERIVNVTVTAAFPLSDTQRDQLLKALTARFQATIVIHTVVDKNILGGAIIQAGDWVIDGSLRGKLAQLGKAMGVSVF